MVALDGEGYFDIKGNHKGYPYEWNAHLKWVYGVKYCRGDPSWSPFGKGNYFVTNGVNGKKGNHKGYPYEWIVHLK